MTPLEQIFVVAMMMGFVSVLGVLVIGYFLFLQWLQYNWKHL